MRTKTSKEEIACPLCSKVLFIREKLEVLRYDRKQQKEVWTIASDINTPVRIYGEINNLVEKNVIFLCQYHFEKAWEHFKTNTRMNWSEVIERIK